MRSLAYALVAACLCTLPPTALSQSSRAEAPGSSAESPPGTDSDHDAGIPLERIIAAVAKKTGKKFLIEPRAHVHVELVGQDVSGISYPELLTILQAQGLTAVEDRYYVRVIPEGSVRQNALPLDTGKETFPDAQYVDRIIVVKNISAAMLVPILRPLVPMQGQLAAYPCTNEILVSDTYANVKKLEAVIHALDIGGPGGPQACSPQQGAGHKEGT